MMTTDHDEVPRTQNSAALRTLHEFQRKLRLQIDELRAIECEDLDVAEVVVFAIESLEQAWDHARESRRRILSDEMPADPVVG